MTGRADIAWSRQVAGSSSAHLFLWATAATLALVVHAGAAWLVMREPPIQPADGEPPAAIMIDLSPVAMAPASEEEQIAPDEVESVAAEAPPSPEPVEPAEPVETAMLVEPEEPLETEAEREPELTEPVELDTAEPVEIDQVEPVEMEEVEPVEAEEVVEVEPETIEPIEDAVPLPMARAPVPTPRPERVERPRPQQQQPAPRRQQRAAPSREAVRAQVQQPREAPRAAAPQTSSGVSSVSPARWQSRLLAHLERRKRYPAEARRARQEGTAQVRFTIDASGNVQSVSLVRSSGVAALDQEVLAMVRRASPVPAPPPGIGRTITVPVRFSLR